MLRAGFAAFHPERLRARFEIKAATFHAARRTPSTLSRISIFIFARGFSAFRSPKSDRDPRETRNEGRWKGSFPRAVARKPISIHVSVMAGVVPVYDRNTCSFYAGEAALLWKLFR